MDTVCVGLSQTYSVLNTPGSIYNWEISGGGVLSQSNSNLVTVDWGSTPGEYTLSVQGTTSEGCVGDLVTSTISVSDTLIYFNQPRTGICLGDTTELIAIPTGGYWSGQNIAGSVFSGYSPGTYYPQYTVNIHGCTVIDSLEIFVRDLFQSPEIYSVLSSVDLCIHGNSQFYFAADDPSIEYTWHVDGQLQTDTDYELNMSWQDSTTSHTITVYGTDTIGCKSETGFINVNVKACHRVYVPNSFTPNGDGFNDAFKINGLSVYEPRLKIYNRYGYVIYEIKSISDSWNGNDGNGYYCPNGVYNWIMTYRDDNGFGQVETGHVVLIR
jgi:gliding motility-associated-like protein